jgi:hypothetical protein
MFKLAGAALVGGAVATVAAAESAAADGGLGVTGSPAVPVVPIRSDNLYSTTGTNESAFLFQSGAKYTSNVDGFSNAALAGWTSSQGFNRDGVYGNSEVSGGYGVYGRAGSGTGLAGNGFVGALLLGQRADLQFSTTSRQDPRTIPSTSQLGMLQLDQNGVVWICTAAGTPGTWQQVAGPGIAGAFHAVTPGRVYDSRSNLPTPGTLAAPASRTVSVKDRRDLASGAVVQADFVPAGATAITANVTVAATVGAGFLAVNPGGVTTVGASTINWSAAGQILANGVTLTLGGDRQLNVIAGGSGGASTQFVIDVTGYYL